MSKETKIIEMDLTNLSDLEPLDPACEFLLMLGKMYKKTLKAVFGRRAILEISVENVEKLIDNDFEVDDNIVKAAAVIASYCEDECDVEELREIAMFATGINEKYVDQAIEFLAKNIKTVITLDTGYETCICLSDQIT